ncbi:MAG: hypothetical protein ACKVQT_07130 [Burkholderiales bacterium]
MQKASLQKASLQKASLRRARPRRASPRRRLCRSARLRHPSPSRRIRPRRRHQSVSCESRSSGVRPRRSGLRKERNVDAALEINAARRVDS